MTTTISPSLGHSVSFTQQGTGTSPGYDAVELRRVHTGFERGEGVATYGSYRVSQRGAGANMSVDISQDDGAWIRGDAVALQGLYQVPPHNATINETVAASDPTNPRIDRVVLEVQDNVHDASGGNLARTRVITGTPSGGATLDNLTGAAAVPSSAIVLADVLVPALSSSVVDANIRDRRPFNAGIPPLLTDVDMVEFEAPWTDVLRSATFTTSDDLKQVAVAMRLTRRIASATRIRWRYVQDGTTALTGNYVIAIFDSSGRKIIDTGSVAFTGAAGTLQQRSETITATTFESGIYYVFFGIDTTNSGACKFHGTMTVTSASAGVSPAPPNVALFAASGGVTVPATILGLTDAAGSLSANHQMPMIALSVG